ncbi:translocation/assembly module TamB domain-containing protein [Henriciella pelagia]|uniref:Translocation/assembly module TamB n=3 Tax=Henriciella pelagia TaxID=1977912 RepID=A0ABQ1JWQ6_9PROT|nr:translocation/assembly module TamB domain-containing protein [Henriciella pelagia]GGB79638.1 translocation/assembly module TamB [Henriciella pelagia]
MTSEPDAPRRKRSAIKWALLILSGLLALVLILLLALRFAAQSSLGRNFVEARIEAAAPSGQDIEVENLSGDLLGKFRIGRLTIADESGVWLVAENLYTDWKPLALRRRALLIDDLEADLIHVLRRPMLVPGEKEDSSGGSLPIRAGALDNLIIRELRTDEGVLPRPLSLGIEGLARVERDGSGASRLSVVPLNGEGDRLAADLSWAEDLRLTGELDLEGPAGGLFAALARLDPEQSIGASLDASGTLDEWSADGSVLISEESALSIEANAAGEAITFTASVHPALHPLTARLTDYLGDTLTLVGDLSTGRDGPRLDLTADADALSLNAQISQAETGAWSADLRLMTDSPDRFLQQDSVSVARAIIDGNLVYDAGTARFDGNVSANGIEAPSFGADNVSGPVIAVYNAPSISVRTTLTGEGTAIPGTAGRIAGRAPLVQTNAQFDLDTRILSVRELLVRGVAGRVTAAGTVTLGTVPSADLAGSFQLDGAAAGLSRPVRAQGQFELSRARDNGTNCSTRLNASNFGSLPAPLDQWSDGQAYITANGRYGNDGRVTLSALTLESRSLKANGSGVISADGDVSASLALSAGEAVVGGANLTALNGQGDVSGSMDNLRFDLRLTSPAISRGEYRFSDVRLNTGGTFGDDGLDAVVDLGADSEAGPLTASTALSFNEGNWALNGLEAGWADLKANANLAGSGGDLASLRGEAFVSGTLPEGLPARDIDLDAAITGDRLALDATFGTFEIGPTSADALVVRATGTLQEANFIIDLDGRTELDGLNYDTSLDVDGVLAGLSGDAPLDLTASVTALLGDIGLTTQSPVRFTQYDDGFDATADLAALGGTLGASLTTRGSTQIVLNGKNLAIAPVLTLAGRPALSGAIDITADLKETADGGLSGPLRGEILGISRQGSDLPPIDLFFSGDLQPALLAMEVRALDNEALTASTTLDLPVITSGAPPFITRDPDRQIPFRATADGQIEAIAALFVPPQMVLKGVVDLDLSGQLPTLDETFGGTLDFSDGVFEHGDLGMVLNRINASTSLGAGRLTLSSFDARGRSGGTLRGSGAMSLDGSGASDLELTADRLVVTERREGRATVSGTMQVNQQPDLLEITGDLVVDEGAINIEKLPSGGPPTLDVSFEQPQEEEAEAEEKAATRLDIQLSAPGRIDINGRGVNAELGLDADIKGTIGEPVITGEARIVRGRFDLVGKRFTFGDSSVDLRQDISASRLNISATHETKDDIQAILNVSGTVKRPEVDLTSNPVLPDDEVLSRVLFGRSPSQLSTLETARLAAALAQLSGGGGFDLLGGIEQALGLDTLDVGSSSSGAVEVTSGKYLTENVYLEVRSGDAGTPGVAIEWEPIRNIEVEAATAAEDGQEFSIQWKKDFEDFGSDEDGS